MKHPTEDLAELAKLAHMRAKRKGFWDEPQTNETNLMLVITELAEYIDADRKKSSYAVEEDAMDAALDAQFETEEGLSYPWLKNNFVTLYHTYLKGSKGEELADAFIRLLDLAGSLSIEPQLNGEDMNEILDMLEHKPIADVVFKVCGDLCSARTRYDVSLGINRCMSQIMAIATNDDIDLFWHVTLKMEYNRYRPKMHGKKY